MDSLYHYLNEAKPYRDEVCLSWAKSTDPFATYSTYCVLKGQTNYIHKIKPNKDNVKNPYIKVCTHFSFLQITRFSQLITFNLFRIN